MFTGIIEELGRVRSVMPQNDGARIEVEATKVLDDAEIGASIAVNGVCLTVVALSDGFAADAVVETLRRTNLGDLDIGDPVNLERPVRLADRLGGHMVQGHVDGVARIAGRDAQPDGSVLVRVATTTPALLRYVVEKGSITIDGISLTVAALHDDGFAVALIPHTLDVTTLGSKAVGATVNLEVDVIAKYVERLLASEHGEGSPS